MEMPEGKSRTEALDLQRRMEETLSGQRPVDSQSYPYFNPDYELPFIHIGTEKQLLLDNFILDGFEGVERVIIRPEKADPPLIEWNNLPWEQVAFTGIVSGALRDPDDGLFKMWYRQSLNGDPRDRDEVLCYAESEDALHWTKPLRDDCLPFGEHKQTNIVIWDYAVGAVVLNRDRSDPDRKFLTVYNPVQEAKRRSERIISRVAASPDGIHWRTISDDTSFRHQHQMRVIWDESIHKWVGFSQHSHAWTHSHTRKIGRQESDDFINWSPKIVEISSEWEPTVDPNVEFHDMSIRKEGGLYIGIVAEAHGEHHWYSNRDGANQHDQFHTKMALYVSRDGHHFARADGYKPWADNGEPGSQDYGYCCHSAAGVLVHDGKMVIPYAAFANKQRVINDPRRYQEKSEVPEWSARVSDQHIKELMEYGPGYPHFNVDNAFGQKSRAVGGLVLREDGWAKLKPTYEQGRVYTKQFVFEGDTLKINADCNYGLIRVELLDSELKPYDGFSAEDCDPIHSPREEIWHRITWKGQQDVSILWNRPVRICFHLLEASLYAFQFEETNG